MSYSILIVDDSGLTRSIIKRTIAMSGIETTNVFEAGNGIQALSTLTTESVDLVLLDLNMPGMGGLDLTKRMRADAKLKDVPVIIVSSESTEGRIEQLKENGVQGYIKKPFTPEQIKGAVEEVLGIPQV